MLVAILVSAQVRFGLHTARSLEEKVFEEPLGIYSGKIAIRHVGEAVFESSVGSQWYIWNYRLYTGASNEVFAVGLYTGNSEVRPGLWYDYSRGEKPEILVYQPFFIGQPSIKGTVSPGLHRYVWDGRAYRNQTPIMGTTGAWLLNPIPICW